MKINIPLPEKALEQKFLWSPQTQNLKEKEPYRGKGDISTKNYTIETYKWHLPLGNHFYQSYLYGWFLEDCPKKPPYNRIIDIGANVGLLSIPFSVLSHKVEAFEPNPNCYDILKRNIKTNELLNINSYNCALLDKNGKGFISDREYSNINSLDIENNEKVYQCNIKKLDDFSFKNVDIIKIDVEGFQIFVLNGGEKTIEKYKPYIIIELNSNKWAVSIIEFMKLNGLEEKVNFGNNAIFGPKA